MALEKIMDIAGTALNAQLVRLNTTATNLANSSVVAGSEEAAYKSKKPVFSSIVEDIMGDYAGLEGGVKVDEIVTSGVSAKQIYDPGNPFADENGYVWGSNVNTVEEMIEMLDASRNYQNNVQIIATTKELMMRTLEITKV
jgi:flagellar basal-body rod protein FlgC